MVVTTMPDLIQGTEKIHVDLSVYGIQIVQAHTQFTALNNTVFGTSSTGNFSDSASAFVLFGLSKSANEDALRSLVYNSVCNIIGTTNGRSSVCIIIPIIKDLHTADLPKEADMTVFVEGVVAGLKDAMKDCSSIVKSCAHRFYFAVPSEMKEALRVAIENVE